LAIDGFRRFGLRHGRQVFVGQKAHLSSQRQTELFEAEFSDFDILVRNGFSQRALAREFERLSDRYAEGRAVPLQHILRITHFAPANFGGNFGVLEEACLRPLAFGNGQFRFKDPQLGIGFQSPCDDSFNGIWTRRVRRVLRAHKTAQGKSEAVRNQSFSMHGGCVGQFDRAV
jgi:hypothetical protein